MDSKLTRLQRDLLEKFFQREDRFFLTGGAALAGFHLGHRETKDLDLFAISDLLDEGDEALTQVAIEIGGSIENIMTSPDFRRRLVKRGEESVVIDLVFEKIPQAYPEKERHGEVRVDVPDEILANKLCTLLSRAEVRDLVDVIALDEAGFSIETALAVAARKDAGLTPAQLSWVLSQIVIGDDAQVPGSRSIGELREALMRLQQRLTRLAYPQESDE